MKLNELYDQPIEIKWREKNMHTWDGFFVVGDIPYYLYIFKDQPETYQDSPLPAVLYDQYKDIIQTRGIWETNFSIDYYKLPPEQHKKFQKELGPHYEFKVTKTGNAVVILSTVIAALREFINTINPALLVFEAKEDSRRKLYEHVVKRFGIPFETFKTRGSTGYMLVF